MPVFVPSREPSPEYGERTRALVERNSKIKAEGREPSIEQKQEHLEALRNEVLDDLVELERMRKQRSLTSKEDLNALDLMVQAKALPLDDMRWNDVDLFLRMPTMLSDEAITAIALYEAIIDMERELDADAKLPPEEQERRAAARRQHCRVLKDEWGVN